MAADCGAIELSSYMKGDKQPQAFAKQDSSIQSAPNSVCALGLRDSVDTFPLQFRWKSGQLFFSFVQSIGDFSYRLFGKCVAFNFCRQKFDSRIDFENIFQALNSKIFFN